MKVAQLFARVAVLLAAFPALAYAKAAEDARVGGASGTWIFANISYAGMRAQKNPSGWRIIAFIFGFPGTLVTLLAVDEGSERMYGIDVPKKIRPE